MDGNSIFIILGVLVGGILAIAGLFRPFLGLLVLMTLHFVQPGELVPAMRPLRIELVYGILVFIVLLWNKGATVKQAITNDKVIRATLYLVIVIFCTVPFAIWRGGAFDSAIEITKLIILQLMITLLLDSQDRLKPILWLLVGFMTWYAGSTFIAYASGQFYTVNGVQRAEGVNSIVGDPNELAGLLLAFLPFLIALLRCSKRFLVKLLLLGCGGLTLVVLMLTGARISLIALLVVVVVYILRSKRRVLNLTVALALALTLWFSLPQQYQKRYLTVEKYAEGGKLDDSNQLRLAIWDAGWRMFLDHPILGVGAGQFPTAYGLVYSGNPHGAWMQPHNLLLQVTCELGLVGLFAFLYLIVQIVKAQRAILRFRQLPWAHLSVQFAFACNLMLIAVGLISIVSHTLYRPYWYLLAGLVSANRRLTESQATAQEELIEGESLGDSKLTLEPLDERVREF